MRAHPPKRTNRPYVALPPFKSVSCRHRCGCDIILVRCDIQSQSRSLSLFGSFAHSLSRRRRLAHFLILISLLLLAATAYLQSGGRLHSCVSSWSVLVVRFMLLLGGRRSSSLRSRILDRPRARLLSFSRVFFSSFPPDIKQKHFFISVNF